MKPCGASWGVPTLLARSDAPGDAPGMLCWGEKGFGEAVETRCAGPPCAKAICCMVGEGVALLEVWRCEKGVGALVNGGAPFTWDWYPGKGPWPGVCARGPGGAICDCRGDVPKLSSLDLFEGITWLV